MVGRAGLGKFKVQSPKFKQMTKTQMPNSKPEVGLGILSLELDWTLGLGYWSLPL